MGHARGGWFARTECLIDRLKYPKFRVQWYEVFYSAFISRSLASRKPDWISQGSVYVYSQLYSYPPAIDPVSLAYGDVASQPPTGVASTVVGEHRLFPVSYRGNE